MISVDTRSSVAPFEQIRSQIADAIRSGQLQEGHRLPAIRQLAADLRAAPGTVAKAYSALESEGLIETSRSRGTRVLGGHAQATEVQRAAQRYIRAVDGLGLEEALSAVRAAWASR